ncbi:methionine adenosyltransferase [Enterococcus rivorum]|uniref:methionine adenosyltransferase n=1 Tax=Enterococcus rivorum TaxID=762845 RepID=UPI00362EB8E1
MNIIKRNENETVENFEFELVERKGVGHPDTICDAIAETASKNYSKFCVENFGNPAHHWFDKVMLIGGEANVDFKNGNIEKPYTIIFAGKVSYSVGEVKIPLEKILFESCVEVLENVLTGFDRHSHLVIENKLVDYQGAGRKDSRYKPSDISKLPKLDNEHLVSNDTNLLSAYAPLSTLENIVLKTEQYINGKAFKTRNPDTGWDVKVFGTRTGDEYNLLVNMPFLAKDISSIEEYFFRKKEILAELQDFLDKNYAVKIDLMMNATDRNGRAYLTALGSVADTGDVGVVGRGNRYNGLITPMRPMSIEAPAGKNSVDHTGKLYGILANDLAHGIFEKYKVPVEVHIYTAKETRLNNPDKVIMKLNNINLNSEVINDIEEYVQEKVRNVGDISRKLIFEGITMW